MDGPPNGIQKFDKTSFFTGENWETGDDKKRNYIGYVSIQYIDFIIHM